MPITEAGQSRVGCCGALSPAPDGYTYHPVGCVGYPSRLARGCKDREDDEEYEATRIARAKPEPDTERLHSAGWVSPDGTFYGCSPYGHDNLAYAFRDFGIIPADTDNPVEWCRKREWVRVYGARSEFWAATGDRLTQAQANTLFDLAVKYKRMKDYEDILDFMEIEG